MQVRHAWRVLCFVSVYVFMFMLQQGQFPPKINKVYHILSKQLENNNFIFPMMD